MTNVIGEGLKRYGLYDQIIFKRLS